MRPRPGIPGASRGASRSLRNRVEFTGDLRGHDFSGQDLSGAFFHDADLCRSSFQGTDLTDAFFQHCFAAEARFEQACLVGWMAAESNFYRASFRGADLRGAHLYRCVLAGADLRAARLRQVTLTLDCNTFEEVQLDRALGAELAYLFGQARSPQRARWRELLGACDSAWLARIFAR